MISSPDDYSIEALTAEIVGENEPDELVDDIMLAIFGSHAATASHPDAPENPTGPAPSDPL